jgi:predicted  nucleic acid-binding Zn-ribbon protein
MSGPAVILREIHRLRRHAQDLQGEIDRAPRAQKAQEARVARQEELLREGHDAIKRLKVKIHEQEVTLRTNNQQIAKHQKQLNEASSKKEYDALQAEINAERRSVGEIEDQILNDMAEVEERTARIPELEQAVRTAKEEAARFAAEAQARQAGLAEQLRQAQDSLQQVEATLPADVRPHYNRLIAARGEDALAAVQGRTCTACYTEITAQNYNELMQGQFVLCKSCGRYLYLPE